MSASKHTPTPWRTVPMIPTGIFSSDQEGLKIAATSDGHGFPKDQPPAVCRANAAFIVKACNSYDSMVKTLEALRDDPSVPAWIQTLVVGTLSA